MSQERVEVQGVDEAGRDASYDERVISYDDESFIHTAKVKDDQHLQGDAGRVEKSAVGRGHYTGCWTSPLGGVPRARCYVSAMTSEGSSGLAEARRRHAGQGLGRPDRPRVERARCMTHLQRVK